MRSNLLLRQGSSETTLANAQGSMQTLQDCSGREIWPVNNYKRNKFLLYITKKIYCAAAVCLRVKT
jgi:hypothetical protein